MDLVDSMKQTFASVFSLYLKAHQFHWNVEGPDFYEFHGLFDTIYSEIYGSVDTFAEEIRALDAFAPGGLRRLADLSQIDDEMRVGSGLEMASVLKEDNQKVIELLTTTYKLAEEAGRCGLSNFLQDRIDAHSKHQWMLRATTKR